MKASVVDVYRQDIKIKKDIRKYKVMDEKQGGKRKEIVLFSKASEKRLLFVCRNSGHHIRSQIGLTYHFNIPQDGETVKKQMNRYLEKVVREYGKIYYLWVLEFQERGAPHFHFFSSLPDDETICKMMGLWWNKIVGESEVHLRFQQDRRSMIPWKMISGKYLSSQYVSKQKQKNVPENFKNVGRFWGCSRNMAPEYDRLFVNENENGLDKGILSAVRIVTKRYENKLKKHYKVKRNFRANKVSYSVPSVSMEFKKILESQICFDCNVQTGERY